MAMVRMLWRVYEAQVTPSLMQTRQVRGMAEHV